MSVEYIDMMRLAGQEHIMALHHGNPHGARDVVRHMAEAYGLPETAAESMLDVFRHQHIQGPLY